MGYLKVGARGTQYMFTAITRKAMKRDPTVMQVRALSDRCLVWKRVRDSGKGEMAEEGVCEKTGALLPTDGRADHHSH